MSNDATRALHELFREDWEHRTRAHPEWASYLGDKRYNDRWTDHSEEGFKARHEHTLENLARLEAIDRSALSPEDQLNYDLFQDEQKTAADEYSTNWRYIALDARGGIQTLDNFSEQLSFGCAKDYEDWIARLEALPTLMDQTISLLREGLRCGIKHSRVVMQRVPRQVESQIVDDAEQSRFYRPFVAMPGLSDAECGRLRHAARNAIVGCVVPSYRKLLAFVNEEYLPGCYEQAGAWQMPGGEEIYRHFVRKYTTTDMTPDEVFETGLQEVARIRAEMEKVKQESGFTGSMKEFFEFLRTDPRFFHETAEDLLIAYRAFAKRIDPLLVKVFRTIPRMPYGVDPIPEAVAPDTTAAYYQPPADDGSRAGSYRVNLYQPESRPTHEIPALSMHEAVPGHHFQIALAMELKDLPDFRRHGHWTAYIEGWALYAESLGHELGLYDNPYAEFGRLTYEIWRAIRLVVDPGIHWKRWTRQQAIDYFLENSPKTELDVVNEIDRYIAWPGQAVAYKIGEIEIQKLRRNATDALGERFDLKEFHEVLLLAGPMPLSVLRKRVEAWVASRRV